MPSVFREYESTPIQIDGLRLLIWRLAQASSIGLMVSLIFGLKIITALSVAGMGVMLLLASYDCFFRNRKDLSAEYKFRENLGGGGCLFFGILILAWAFFHQF